MFGRQVSRIAEFRVESRFISPAARKFTFIRPLKRGCVFLQAFRGGRKIVGKTEDGETQGCLGDLLACFEISWRRGRASNETSFSSRQRFVKSFTSVVNHSSSRDTTLLPSSPLPPRTRKICNRATNSELELSLLPLELKNEKKKGEKERNNQPTFRPSSFQLR